MRWCVLALLIGCTDETPVIVMPNLVALDVVLAPNGLTIHADSTHPGCATRFPKIGGVVHVSDIREPCDPPAFGCIERITYAGAAYLPPTTNAPMVIASPPSGPTLLLEGCGTRAMVELPIITFPTPPTIRGSVIYDASNRIVDVGWESDPRATSHLVTLATSLWSEVHHVDRGDDRFTTPYAGSLFTIVQALLPGREHITALGLVRIWPASEPTTDPLEATTRL